MLISMHSILGWASFCMNYCINAAWHGGNQPVALLRCNEAQVALIAAFWSSALLGLVSLIFLLTIHHRFSMGFRSGEFAGQSSTVTPWSWSALKCPGRWLLTVDFRKHSGPTPADDMAAQIIIDCGIFTLDFKINGFCASPHFLQNRGPCFPNKIQNLLSSEKRTLDHWATVQFFFSLAQVRCFWRCFCFRSGLVALFLKISEHGDSWCTDSSFSSLLVKLSQVFESALLDGILKLVVIPVACATFPYPISSFQSTLHFICFDTALCEQPPLSVMTLCDLPSSWRAKSAVFPIIILSKNKRYPEFILYGWSFIETQMLLF